MPLNEKSKSILSKVHPDLQAVVLEAAKSDTKFVVLEGMRTIERQKQLIAAGASWTLKSRHLTGHAVDLGAVVGNLVRWDWNLYYPLADVMREAALKVGVSLTWGGVWDRELNVLSRRMKEEVEAYQQRYRALKGRAPNIDGPHYQLSEGEYPA